MKLTLSIRRTGNFCHPHCMFIGDNGIERTGFCLLFKVTMYHREDDGKKITGNYEACDNCLKVTKS